MENNKDLKNKIDRGLIEYSKVEYLYKYLEDKSLFDEGIDRLIKGEPVQYIVGNVDFCGNKILVNKSVLIPRFETEELVMHTVQLIKQNFYKDDLNIIDLGTGSGCIAITLKKMLPNATVTAVDISKEALEVARQNALLNEVEINFIESDFLDKIDSKFDVVISNPPYLKESDDVMEIVKNNEPNIALYAKNNGLLSYQKILSTVSKNLNDKFFIAFETGMDQTNEITALAFQNLGVIQIRGMKDMQGRDRFLFIKSND